MLVIAKREHDNKFYRIVYSSGWWTLQARVGKRYQTMQEYSNRNEAFKMLDEHIEYLSNKNQ